MHNNFEYMYGILEKRERQAGDERTRAPAASHRQCSRERGRGRVCAYLSRRVYIVCLLFVFADHQKDRVDSQWS